MALTARGSGPMLAGHFSPGNNSMDQTLVAFPQPAILETAEPARLGLRAEALERLCAIIEGHIADNHYPGAQVAVARHGKLALYRSFGAARIAPERVAAGPDTLWLMYSNTKVVTAAAIWVLVEEGALTFHDRIADHVPEFARNGKGDITLLQVLTHQGGFPNAVQPMPVAAWTDHALMRQLVCDITLEWTPGSRLVYHSAAAHWTAAVLIEAITKSDYREFIRTRVIEPLGLGHELFVGLPDAQFARAVAMHEPKDGRQVPMPVENSDEFRRAGFPGAGGFGTARAMAAFYQALVQGGRLNGGPRLVSRRMMEYVTSNFTGELVDGAMGMPMHRGIGPHVRGTTPFIRGLGSIASPRTFGHGGVGSSYCWADPDSGLSFAYLTNSRIPDPWHSRRLDIISSAAHAAIEDV
jgi:CubicO group peptidase (beta-lactamase class C family)